MHALDFRVPPFAVTTVAAAMTITMLAAGCASGSSSAALSAFDRPEEADISVAALPTADLAGLYIAQDDGLFARQGLHVTIETVASSRAVIAAQLAGRVDICAGSYIPYISAQAQGDRFRILAEASSMGPDNRGLYVRAGSAVTSLGQLAGGTIGVNTTNSIGTLLISTLLSEYGISPKKVKFVADPAGFPAMPAALSNGAWGAAYLSEPYVTLAEEKYGEVGLADLDQGSSMNFPIAGYIATASWAREHPRTAAAFVRAIEAGQAMAATDRAILEQAMAKSDDLPPTVTAVMALPTYPQGPVNQRRIQREAAAMLQFGMLNPQYAAEVNQGTLVRSMIGSG
jgi:NitT/TauT family transport system substrate-binding protein